ncbi:unnamed protein product (macronuclear) [Paramecium tetraurelia]|uniref:RING-type domain-containing protein n=1 Tax=Paramecium tetraurelia TaxID=5888 RepID=A0DKW0_PARTE|nr:uncharacterized protein GSPATT00017994001 [Paramecium tetraurelia]CAK83677.1 unnamed protein product [Paramecium tetraurelia]|eukprot:XP_001451074.1 hypothetical protein (macronuclear) [Paramecium tetraurelia strain d4-2]
MSQEVQLFFICTTTEEDRLKDPSLKDYKYLQYMGRNKNAAILYSLMHYALNRKQPKILQEFTELMNLSRNISKYWEIRNVIQKSKDLINPVEMFFQNLFQVDQKSEIAQKLLYEFCCEKGLLKGQDISFPHLAQFFKMRISINNYENYCEQFKDSIDLICTNSEKYFYLIPEPIIYKIPSNYCNNCKSMTEQIKVVCQHQFCYKCIEKSVPFICCGKYYFKNNLQSEIEKLLRFKEYNERSKELQKYYESTRQCVQQQLQDDKKQQIVSITDDPLQECNLCFRKFQYQLFILRDCKHQYCYDCMFERKHQKYCMVNKCFNKIDYLEFNNYLIQAKSDHNEQVDKKQNQIQQLQSPVQESRIMEYCSKCNTLQCYKLFQIKNCKHKFCNQCLQNTNMRYVTLNCLVNLCVEQFKSQDYQNYIKQLQEESKSEEFGSQRKNIQIKLLQFECDECFIYRDEDQKYILNCGHSVCQICIIKDDFYKKCCQSSSRDSEYVSFRKNITVNCKGCQNNFPLKNLHRLACKHEFCCSCCQKIIQRKPYKCLEQLCEKDIAFSTSLIKFISDQIAGQKKESEQIVKSYKISNQKEEEPKIDKKLENQSKSKSHHIVIHEEEKLIEQNPPQSFTLQEYNKTEEEKSLSVQSSVKNIQDVKQPKQDNPKQQEEFIQVQKDISLSNGQNLILNQNQKRQNKSPFFEVDKVSQVDEEEILFNKQLDEIKLAEEKESEFYTGFCTNCYQQFSSYNRKQVINCKSHEIGVCCTLTKFRNCPQCEQATTKSKLKIKQSLILPTNPVEFEQILSTTLPKTALSNYWHQPYEQTYQSPSEKFQNIDRLRYTEGSAAKRNNTTDTINKRVLESQKNDLTLQRYQPQPSSSYYPVRLERNNYGKLDHDYKLVVHSNNFTQIHRNPTYFQRSLI